MYYIRHIPKYGYALVRDCGRHWYYYPAINDLESVYWTDTIENLYGKEHLCTVRVSNQRLFDWAKIHELIPYIITPKSHPEYYI